MRLDLSHLAAGVLALILPLDSAFAGAGAGALTQLSGTDACVSSNGSGGDCAEGVALVGVWGVAVSPDGKNVYTAAQGQAGAGGGVAAFARNRRSGALRQLAGTDACVSYDGSGGACATGVGLNGAIGVAASHDGRNVYVLSTRDTAVAAFGRDRRTGALRQLAGTAACISASSVPNPDCAPGVGMRSPVDLAVSRDGKNVYVGSDVAGVAVFVRSGRSGALRQLAGTDACVSHDGSGGVCAVGVGVKDASAVAISHDGKNVYAAAKASHSVAVFARDRRTGALRQLTGTAACISESGSGGDCVDGVALDGASGVAVSPDGRNVYVASQESDAVAVFARDRRTGALRQLAGTDACVSADGSGGACEVGVALDIPQDVAVSPDGGNVYVATGSDIVTVFARDRRSGALRQLAGTDACVSEDGSGGDCTDDVALDSVRRLAISGDGKHAYFTARVNGSIAAFARETRGRH